MHPNLGFRMRWQSGKCFYCHNKMSKPPAPTHPQPRTVATLDELVPQSKGGKRELNNQVAACKRCNNIKGDMDLVDFLHYMRTQEFRERWHSNRPSRKQRREAKEARKRLWKAAQEQGRLAERIIAPALKADEPKGSEGSNPSPSSISGNEARYHSPTQLAASG